MEYLTIKAFLNWVRKVPSWVWLALAIAGSVWFYGHLRYNAGQAEAEAKLSAYKTEVQKAVAIRLTQNKIKEAQDRQVFAQIAEQYKKDIADAKAEGNRIAADLRAGNIKLRKQWQCCSVPAKAADGSSGADEEARLREESAGRIIGNAAEADSWIRALQDTVRQLQAEPVK